MRSSEFKLGKRLIISYILLDVILVIRRQSYYLQAVFHHVHLLNILLLLLFCLRDLEELELLIECCWIRSLMIFILFHEVNVQLRFIRVKLPTLLIRYGRKILILSLFLDSILILWWRLELVTRVNSKIFYNVRCARHRRPRRLAYHNT